MNGLILTASGSLLVNKSYQINIPLSELRANISTDELYPVEYCFYFQEIGRYAIAGDRFGKIGVGYISGHKIKFVVAGENFGCGSAREHAVITLKEAGVELIFAKTFNRTFRENCVNNNIATTTNSECLNKYLKSKIIPVKEIAEEFTGIEKEKFLHRNHFIFHKQKILLQKQKKVSHNPSGPMTIAEKIIARKIDRDHSVSAGEQMYVPVDKRFTYELFAPLIFNILKTNGINISEIVDPSSILFFEDHFVLSRHPQLKVLLAAQKDFCQKIGGRHGKFGEKGSGICHAVLVQDHVLPGQIIIGTDSHTSTSGALNALSLAVGATEMAHAFSTKNLLVKVPQTIRVNLAGKLAGGVMAKDIILNLFRTDVVRKKRTIGSVLEFGGEGLNYLPVDELAVLTNMSTEAGAWTGIVEPTELMVKHILASRTISETALRQIMVLPDKGASYLESVEIDLSKVEPMISLPGDPTNSIPIKDLTEKIQIHKAFIGSCTGGKMEDLVKAAQVLKGKKVAKGVELVVHAATRNIYDKAEKEGLIDIIIKAGGKVYPSACGACAGQGPGSPGKDEVVISSSNRNYHGRMGPGKAYLSNPMVVASSAICGYISSGD